MSLLVISINGANVGCAPFLRAGDEPAVVIQIAKHDQVMEARLRPDEAEKLGRALLEDANSLKMIQGPLEELNGEPPWGGSL